MNRLVLPIIRPGLRFRTNGIGHACSRALTQPLSSTSAVFALRFRSSICESPISSSSSSPAVSLVSTPSRVPLSSSARFLKLALFGTVALVVGVGISKTEAEEKPKPSEEGIVSNIKSFGVQILDQFVSLYGLLSSFAVGDDSLLLPPANKDAFGKVPRTVVLNFEETLVYSSWTREKGWLLRKRPGVDNFLFRLTQAGYEIVLFASTQQIDSEQNVIDFDRQGTIRTKLYRDKTNYVNGRLVKDLRRLNRDLKRVIVIDHDGFKSVLQSENVFLISPFKDNLSDKELAQLAKMLEDLQRHNVYDVREVAKRWNAGSRASVFEEEEKLNQEAKRILAKQE